MSDYEKYLKYKNKYLVLKNQIASSNNASFYDIPNDVRTLIGEYLDIDGITKYSELSKGINVALYTGLQKIYIEEIIIKDELDLVKLRKYDRNINLLHVKKLFININGLNYNTFIYIY